MITGDGEEYFEICFDLNFFTACVLSVTSLLQVRVNLLLCYFKVSFPCICFMTIGAIDQYFLISYGFGRLKTLVSPVTSSPQLFVALASH